MIATQIGENAVAFTVTQEKTAECVRIIRSLYHSICGQNIPEIISIRPALDTIIVQFQSDYDWNPFVARLESINMEEMSESYKIQTKSNSIVRIPVCFDEEYSRDLKSVSAKTGLSREEIVRKLNSVTYEVWMMGFMPGFPYLGELPQQLQIARKSKPEHNIPSGSVAI